MFRSSLRSLCNVAIGTHTGQEVTESQGGGGGEGGGLRRRALTDVTGAEKGKKKPRH